MNLLGGESRPGVMQTPTQKNNAHFQSAIYINLTLPTMHYKQGYRITTESMDSLEHLLLNATNYIVYHYFRGHV